MNIKNTENVHRELFNAHWELTSGADRLHGVLVSLCASSRHAEARTKLQPIIAQLESARDMIDGAWKAAGDARTELIRLTGCDGTCKEHPRPSPEDDRG